MRDWWVDHPCIVLVTFFGSTVAGAAAGTGLAWRLVDTRTVVNNPAAGAVLGLGGALVGALLSVIVLMALSERHSRRSAS